MINQDIRIFLSRKNSQVPKIFVLSNSIIKYYEMLTIFHVNTTKILLQSTRYSLVYIALANRS